VRSYGLTCVLARQPSPPPSPSPLSLHDALPISEKAEQELAQLKTQSFIASALREHGLSEDLSEFVSGGSEEEIKAKVAKLAEKRSEEHTSELQSRENLVCRLLLEKKKEQTYIGE